MGTDIPATNLSSPHHPDGTSIANTWIARVFDSCPLGIVQIDLAGRIQYANAQAASMMGMPQWAGKTLFDLVLDPATSDLVRSQLSERLQGVTGDYQLEIKRADDGRKIAIQVAAMPVGEPGSVTGAVAIIRSLEIERAVLAFNQSVASAKTAADVLQAVAASTQRVVPFDAFIVSMISRDSQHSRVLFEFPSHIVDPRTRWFRLNPKISEEIVKSDKSTWRLQDLLAMQAALRNNNTLDPAIRSLSALIDKGYQWLIRYPVHSEGRQVGGVSLLRKGASGFSSHEEALLKTLPLDKALLVALHFESRKEVEFRLNLVKEISAKLSDRELFDMLVSRIAHHYGWSHVSLFTIDAAENKIVLRSQQARSSAYLLPPEHVQSVDTGVLGYAYRYDKNVNVPNVHIDPEFSTVYLKSPMSVRITSEACVRVIANGRIAALLNIEDARENAFADDDFEALGRVVEEIGEIIGRRMKDNLAVAALASTTSAVFVLASEGTIIHVNPAAEELSGQPAELLIGHSIAELIDNPDTGRFVARAPTPRGEVDFRRPGEEKIRVLIEGVPLDNCFGQRLIIARSLRIQRRVEHLESVRDMFGELARQVNAPLSIIGTALRDLARSSHSKPAALPEKISLLVEDLFKQLKKLELTYDKMMFYGDPEITLQWRPTRVYLQHFIDDLIGDLPAIEREDIKIVNESSVKYLDLDVQQITFVMETILACLLRSSAKGQQVEFAVTNAAGGGVRFSLSGLFPAAAMSSEQAAGGRALKFKWPIDLEIAAKTMHRFVTNHRGVMHEAEIRNSHVFFLIDLPQPEESLLTFPNDRNRHAQEAFDPSSDRRQRTGG
jgi:PAS domain S-box-containing protein